MTPYRAATIEEIKNAAGWETDKMSFSTLFGSRETAEGYLDDLVDMANHTPFLYDDLTAMSKTLATYGYNVGDILPALTGRRKMQNQKRPLSILDFMV